VTDRLDLSVTRIGVGVLEPDAEAEVVVQRTVIAEFEPGEFAQRDRPGRDEVGRTRIELREPIGSRRRGSLDLGGDRTQREREAQA
jgi:hypothetical protein